MTKISEISPPGPKGKLLGELFSARKDPLDLFLTLTQEYGGIVRFRVAHIPFYLVSKKEAIKRILQDNLKNYQKGMSYEHLRAAMGKGLLVSEGDLWKQQRKWIQPAFHREKLAQKISVMTDAIGDLLEQWKPLSQKEAVIDIVSPFMHLAFDMVGRILMGEEIEGHMEQMETALNEAGDEVYHRMETPFRLPEFFPTPRNRRYKKALQTLYQVVDHVITRHRESKKETESLLSSMVSVRDEKTGEGMSDTQIRDEVLTFLMAGHETTGDALCWTFYLLAEHPEVVDRLGEEVDRVLGSRTPTAEDLPGLIYVGQVIDESMRLYPPAWAFTRTAIQEDVLEGYHIPQGANIIISPYVNHRVPDLWENPDLFNPDRFSPDQQAQRHIYDYFPFGGGPHTCIGRHFSLLELKLCVAMITQRYRLQLAENQSVEATPRISLRPLDQIRMKICSR